MDSQPIVIDNGSFSVRAGFAGEDKPALSVPSFVGRPKHQRVMAGGSLQGSQFVGQALEEHRGALKLSAVLDHGHINSWSDMELIWKYLYDNNGLKVPSDVHPVLLTEAIHTPRAQRERAAEIMFEALHVPALYIGPTPVLALYGSGRTTGTVVEVGEGVTSVTPIYEAFACAHAVSRAEYGGREVTEQLARLLAKGGAGLHTTSEKQVVRAIKEAACYVSPTPGAEEAAVLHRTYSSCSYTLPDGSALTLGPERFRAPEALFKPALLGLEYGGVADLVASSISRCDLELRRALLGSLVLSGGPTCTRGFGARLLTEVRRAVPGDSKIRVFAPSERALLPWIGGSILSSLSTFRKLWVSKEQWMEEGPAAMHKAAI